MAKFTQANEVAKSRIVEEIVLALGYDPLNPPVQVDDKQAAAALGIKASTLSVWRSTGRYNLPFVKVGRMVRYRISDLAEFLAGRTVTHTGEGPEMKKSQPPSQPAKGREVAE